QAELPDERAERGANRDRGENPRTAIEPHRKAGQDKSDRKEADHRGRAIGNVTRELGKADDLHVGRVRHIFVTQIRFEPFCDFEIVEAFLRLRIEVQKLGADHRAAEIRRDETADKVGAQRVLENRVNIFRRTGKVGRDNVARFKPFFRNRNETRVRRPERCHRVTGDAGDIEEILRDVVQLVEEVTLENVAFLVLENNKDAVTATETLGILEEGFDIGVANRQHLREARIHAELRSKKAHHKREGQQKDQDRRTQTEYEIFNTLQNNLPVGSAPFCKLSASKVFTLRPELRLFFSFSSANG